MNGKCLLNGMDIGLLSGPDFMDVLMELFVSDGMHEEEYLKARDKARAQTLLMMRGKLATDYDSTESYGRSNDDFGPPMESGPPMPFINPTEQDESGYFGLMPPMDA